MSVLINSTTNRGRSSSACAGVVGDGDLNVGSWGKWTGTIAFFRVCLQSAKPGASIFVLAAARTVGGERESMARHTVAVEALAIKAMRCSTRIVHQPASRSMGHAKAGRRPAPRASMPRCPAPAGTARRAPCRRGGG
jgi:hypothetical protein